MFKKILQDNNIFVTKQRIAVLEALSELSKPVRIEELLEKMKNSIDTATAYRTLSLFSEKGIVYRTDFGESASYFELQKEGHHHHHLVCTSCREKSALDFCPNSEFRKIQKNNKFTITHHIFEIFGLCENCQN